MQATDLTGIVPKRRSAGYLLPGAILLCLLLCLPLFTLGWLALNGTTESVLHIATTVLPSAGLTTILLMLGVGVFTATVGTLAAWLVTFFRFPGRNLMQWALMLPLAVPTYISAYTFVEFFSYTGPLQETVREIGGYQSSREYWFPEIRSLWGTVFVLGLVLYPYVYLCVRTLFWLQGNSLADSARVLGATGSRLFFRITLPVARPAIVLGVTLALMETINDIGAVEYLGTHTLTFSVFSVWLNQSDLAGAAQIALFILILVFGLIYLEHVSRGARQYNEKSRTSKTHPTPEKISGLKAIGASAFTVSLFTLGFGVPVYVLARFAYLDLDTLVSDFILGAVYTTVLLGTIAALLAVICGLILGFLLRTKPTRANQTIVRFASIGYAVPGTLIALGVFIPLAALDNIVDGFLRDFAGISSGLLLTGSGAALVFAYVVRFMAMAEGSVENGLAKLSPNLDMAARNLGRKRSQVLSQILLPLMVPAISSAALLVFVDVVKELSATILLRPFGMNTLATYVYDYASQGRVEDGALACLLIVMIGIAPVLLLTRTQIRKS